MCALNGEMVFISDAFECKMVFILNVVITQFNREISCDRQCSLIAGLNQWL